MDSETKPFIPKEAAISEHSCMAKNVVNRDVNSAFRPQHKLVTFVGQGNVPFGMSNTKGNTSRVLGIIEATHTFTTRNDKSIHLKASAKPVSSAVLLLYEVADKNVG